MPLPSPAWNDDHVLDARLRDPFSGEPTFSLRNRATRLLFQTAWLILARWTPPPFHPWRRLLLIAFGAKLGRGNTLACENDRELQNPVRAYNGEGCGVASTR